MNSSPARWALAHLDAWTWLVAEYRIWLIVIATLIGIAAPLLSAARKRRPRPAPSVVIRSAAMALGFSAATVTACSLLHFSDLRWLAPGQRATAHLSAPWSTQSQASRPSSGLPRYQSTPPSPARSWLWLPSS
jgi:hypothetical protein